MCPMNRNFPMYQMNRKNQNFHSHRKCPMNRSFRSLHSYLMNLNCPTNRCFQMNLLYRYFRPFLRILMNLRYRKNHWCRLLHRQK